MDANERTVSSPAGEMGMKGHNHMTTHPFVCVLDAGRRGLLLVAV